MSDPPISNDPALDDAVRDSRFDNDIFSRPRPSLQAPPFAGFGIRALASLIDGFALVLVAVPLDLIFGASNELASTSGFLQFMISLFYQGYLPTTPLRGTFGKYLLNLKIETLDGQQINTLTSLRRLLLLLTVQPVLLMFPFNPQEPDLWAAIPTLICFAILLGDVLLVAIRPDRRALHDLIAGTCVRLYPPKADD